MLVTQVVSVFKRVDRTLPGRQCLGTKEKAQIKFLFVLFLLFLQQAEGKEDESYDDSMNVVPKTPQSL